MKKPIFVGVAGGSGSGKSTLCVSLCKKYPEIFSLMHLDDKFVPKDQAPTIHGFTNWDCPEALRFDDLYRELLDLKEGRSVTVKTKSELYNPEYTRESNNRIEVTIHPTPIVLVEGYLLFADENIRSILDHEIFLSIPIEESLKRRSGNKFAPDLGYIEKVLIPMHEKYVFPTGIYANLVLEAGFHSQGDILRLVEGYFRKHSLL